LLLLLTLVMKTLYTLSLPLLALILTACQPSQIRNGIPNFPWIAECGSQTQPPVDKKFMANDYGAVADTAQLSTAAIQQAIDACAAAGGGMVSFEPGTYSMGSVFLKSNVNLNIPEGVTILGSQNIQDYPLIFTRVAGIEMEWPAALITAMDQDNVAVSGRGLVSGRGKVFWDSYWEMRREYVPKGLRWIVDYDCKRPRLLLMQNCSNVTLSETKFIEAGFWTVHILYSTLVTIKDLIIDNNNAGKGPSTDGIDIDSSNRVLIEDCDISCNDDNFCLKAGRDADGLRVNRPTEYVVIRNCIARYGDGLFTCGSETSGGIRKVVAYDLEAIGTKIGLRFKSAYTRGGVVEDIYLANIKMRGLREPLQINLNWNPSYSYSSLPEAYDINEVPPHWKVMLTPVDPPELGMPKFRNVYFTDIRADSCSVAIVCEGAEKSTIDQFHLENVHITGAKAGRIYWANDWELKNVWIGGEKGELVDIQHTVNVPLYQQ